MRPVLIGSRRLGVARADSDWDWCEAGAPPDARPHGYTDPDTRWTLLPRGVIRREPSGDHGIFEPWFVALLDARYERARERMTVHPCLATRFRILHALGRKRDAYLTLGIPARGEEGQP